MKSSAPIVKSQNQEPLNSNNQQAETTTAKVEAEYRLPDGWKIERQVFETRRERRKFAIKIEYPRLIVEGHDLSKEVDGFNKSVRRFIINMMNETIPDVRDIEKERSGYRDIEEEAWVSYEISHVSDEIVSLMFDIHMDDWESRRIVGFPTVFNYDLKREKEIKLRDIFKPHSNYAKTLAEYCERDLKVNQYNSEPLPKRDQTVANFTVSDKGLKIFFGKCEFAPCSADVHSVIVPFDAVKETLNPQSPVAKIARGECYEEFLETYSEQSKIRISRLKAARK